MKRIAITVSVVGLVFGVAILAQTQTESVELELIRLENEVNDAWIKRDVEAYARLLADDYISTNSYGDMKTKAQSMETPTERVSAEQELIKLENEWADA